MKEYIAKTGGRYTYNDDLLNLQELAMSMSAIFEGCSNFIISGCNITGGRITPGYVWINGRVRYFEGVADPTLPYYIYEKNHYETITYAGDVNKHGRCNYLSAGSSTISQENDEVTGNLPGYIEIRSDYAPRLIDKFVGRYALLLDSPFTRQTVKKDLLFSGTLTVEKELESRSGLSVASAVSGYSLRSVIKESGDGSVGIYHNGLLVNEIVVGTDGKYTLSRQGAALMSVDANGLYADNVFCSTADFGSVRITGNDIFNHGHNTDEAQIRVNRIGYNGGNTRYRNFIVYDGRTANPLFVVEGKSSRATVNGGLTVSNNDGLVLKSPAYLKSDKALVSLLQWQDRESERIGYIGYAAADAFDLTLRNDIGNMTIASKGFVDIQAELRVGGISLADTYVTLTDFGTALSGKVDKVSGKGLSTEDFTTAYRNKLDSIAKGSLSSGGEGWVTAGEVAGALATKLTANDNLGDLANVSQARGNLNVYSKAEGDGRYLRITNYLSEITALSASEVEGKTTEQIIQIREARQQTARENIDAEKKGTGDLKLAKASNLSDVGDKAKARQNIGVYSIAEIDSMLAGKLGNDAAYSGLIFTSELKTKLDGIKTGAFAGIDNEGVSQSQVEGYVTTSAVVKQLALKAPRLLDGYSAADKATIAANIGVYSASGADAKFAVISQGLSDLIAYQVKQGKTTNEAKKVLRDNIGAAASTDLDGYVKRDGKLLDLVLADETARKQACSKIGAAYAGEYQTKIADTGWVSCGGENTGTLWARQIGNIVCIQGIINTAKRSSNTWGSIATIPNSISPPRFGCRQTMADFNDSHKYNRGCSFVINAGSRTILMHERGTYNVNTNLSFSYMT